MNKSYADISWRLEGPFDSTYSLALLNRETARAMKELGVDVSLFSTEGPGDFEPSPDFLSANPDLATLNMRSQSMDQREASATSRNLYPPRVEDMACGVNLLHSYAWEESAFPPAWVRNFNSHLTGLACLSRHVLKVMQDNGVRLPAVVSGCGVDHWERVKAAGHSALDSIGARPFRFLHVSSFFPRKGPDALLEAYGRAFTEADDVCLVIKTFPNPHNQVHQQLAAVRDKYPAYPQVVVLEEDFSDAELKALYLRCQVLVAPSCAEGYGLPLAEAMLSGLPVITTAWSGQMDFCRSDNAWLVDYMFEQADTHFGLLPSAWAAIDIDELASAMMTAKGTPEAERLAMAQRGRVLLLQEFTWSKVAERLVDFYRQLAGRKSSEPAKVGWVTTWNVKCGIATYSEHLIAGMVTKPFMLAARNDQLLRPDVTQCSRCWEASDDDDLTALARIVDVQGLDVIVIQYNFGFFHHDNLHRFMKSQKEAGRVVVVDMHATIDPPQAPHKRLANYIPALALADRLLAHSIGDLNRLKSLGLVDNVALFPHGVLDVSLERKSPTDVPTIATYGFCLPHKGLEQVIEAIAILRDAGHRVCLKMVNAVYPVDFSADLANSLAARVKALDLTEQVSMESRFLSDEDSLTLLHSADAVLFVYHPTSESASGAVRYGLATGKPTLVTDLPIFSEFGEAVWRVADNSPELLADAIRTMLDHVRGRSEEYKHRQSLAGRWREQHSYKWLAARLEGMVDGLHSSKQSPEGRSLLPKSYI